MQRTETIKVSVPSALEIARDARRGVLEFNLIKYRGSSRSRSSEETRRYRRVSCIIARNTNVGRETPSVAMRDTNEFIRHEARAVYVYVSMSMSRLP